MRHRPGMYPISRIIQRRRQSGITPRTVVLHRSAADKAFFNLEVVHVYERRRTEWKCRFENPRPGSTRRSGLDGRPLADSIVTT